MTLTRPDAGWYPDSNGQTRYWDGFAWTDHAWNGTAVEYSPLAHDPGAAHAAGSAGNASVQPVHTPARSAGTRGQQGNGASQVVAVATCLLFGVLFSLFTFVLIIGAAGSFAVSDSLSPFGGSQAANSIGARAVLLSLVALALTITLFVGATQGIIHSSSIAAIIGLAVSALLMLVLAIATSAIIIILMFVALVGMGCAIAEVRARPAQQPHQ